MHNMIATLAAVMMATAVLFSTHAEAATNVAEAKARSASYVEAFNRRDAEARGLADGDIVRIYNDRGSCLAGVTIDDRVRQGVVQMSTGAWYDPLDPAEPGSPCKHGNPNVLTPDKGTSRLGQGPIAHSCLVDIERHEGPVPPVTAYDPPEILRESSSTAGLTRNSPAGETGERNS